MSPVCLVMIDLLGFKLTLGVGGDRSLTHLQNLSVSSFQASDKYQVEASDKLGD